MRECWCGNTDFIPFGPDYGKCQVCETLVNLREIKREQLLVQDDESDFYGKKYWVEHQQDSFGYADIHTRARHDLHERNLHWLRTLLKYRLPPANVMELGCAHGSFVALMEQAGYLASGVEMSPWVVNFAKKTFGVPICVGPVESLNVPRGSLDVIALMDVLEHLPDPAATIKHCLELLKPDGLLLIQTPEFKGEMRHDTLIESKSTFLDQLKPDEHLYLFSEGSVTEFFRRLGAKHIYFEPAIFAHYDMFFAVSREPLTVRAPDQIESALLTAPERRFALALLDLDEKNKALVNQVTELSAHRDSAISQVHTLTAWLLEARAESGQLKKMLSRPMLKSIRKFSDLMQEYAKKIGRGGGR